MNWREIAITLSIATLTSVLCATVFYESVCSISISLHKNSIPLEPCVLIAVASAITGSIGYFCALHGNSKAIHPTRKPETGLPDNRADSSLPEKDKA